MEQSLINFRNRFREQLSSFLWRQWDALGVAGYEGAPDTWYIDPEALLLFSLSISRNEARLFDEVIDWLATNGDYINIQRLKTILAKEGFSSGKVLNPVAEIMSHEGRSLKWKGLVKSLNIHEPAHENLFFSVNEEPVQMYGSPDKTFYKYGLDRGKLQLRQHSQQVRNIHNPGVLFKLRALFGINVRCEIILYLLTHESANPSKIARETYYAQKTVQDTLVDMVKSGLLFVKMEGREKHYWLRTDKWFDFLNIEKTTLQWTNWPSLLIALEKIWLKINDDTLMKMDSLMQSSELRRLMVEIRPKIETAGFGQLLSDEKQYLGESYSAVFLADIEKILVTGLQVK
jgi:predicted transcriptional regulator